MKRSTALKLIDERLKQAMQEATDASSADRKADRRTNVLIAIISAVGLLTVTASSTAGTALLNNFAPEPSVVSCTDERLKIDQLVKTSPTAWLPINESNLGEQQCKLNDYANKRLQELKAITSGPKQPPAILH